ncbi:MAG TPA: dihydrodipicolinate synthase family protein [Rhodopirellula baltica]|uniref:Dihydrodipicolinate synthase n=2 Tax=Rhodopirellula TaxID=265488 RepID=Q7USB5_RHOBA|nr:dihydrodipicolinate synthase family protein [Rhodopirellula baltica]CAD73882.1 dihydrodipicolinate synthase [Rhodopirellula baltica SH 1]HBE64735.1 dihydrodipicolinate synthase family protein [Rhodopirellula baltica]
MNRRISGILTPNITPVDDRGRVDEDKLRGYVDWLIDHGVDGLYPNGSTGEFVRFTAEERRHIVRIVVDQAAGRVPVLAGAAEANVEETIEACNAYGDMGVRAVAIVAPFYYPISSEGVHAYYAHIARGVRVDVTLYNIPLFASPIEVDVVIRLAEEYPRIIGLKDSSGDLPNLMRMMAAIRPMRDDFSFLTGWDAALAPMLIAGADGGTNATSGVLPELTRAIHRACADGDHKLAMELQYMLLPLFDAMIGLGEFPAGFRAGARARGWDLGRGRVPLSDKQQALIVTAEREINAMVRSTQAKMTGSSELPLEAIQVIARRVMEQLEK